MSRRYRTVAGVTEAEVVVKRSRFLATLARVSDEESARAVVQRLRKEHWDARHHCSAYVLGPTGEPGQIARSSDDGEPAGTAGAPMLEVLRGAELADCVAVVTRWFGGTLLGAGGLVRAYGDAVRLAVANATVIERGLVHECVVVVDHADAGRLESELRARGISVLEVAYAERVRLLLGTPDVADLKAQLAGLTAGAVVAEWVGESWVDLPRE